MIICSISIILLASLLAGRRPQCNAGLVQQEMYSITPIHWNIISAPASTDRSRVGPSLYVFSLLGIILGSCPERFLYTITLPTVSCDAPYPLLYCTTLELASRVLLSSKKPAFAADNHFQDPLLTTTFAFHSKCYHPPRWLKKVSIISFLLFFVQNCSRLCSNFS